MTKRGDFGYRSSQRGRTRPPREKPYCQSGRRCHLVDLYGSSDDPGRRCAVLAMAYAVRAMQPSTRHLAKAAIPHVLDWCHEDEIWEQLKGVGWFEFRDQERSDVLVEAGGMR